MTINGTRSFSSTCAAGLVTFVTGQRPFQGASTLSSRVSCTASARLQLLTSSTTCLARSCAKASSASTCLWNSTGSAVNSSATERHCKPEFAISDPEVREQFVLFVLFSITTIVFHCIKLVAPSNCARALDTSRFLLVCSSGLDSRRCRKKASLALVFYFYAFVVKWRVYQTKVIGIAYDERLFYTLLLVSGGIIWISPYFGMFSMTSVFTYYKPEALVRSAAEASQVENFFPILSMLPSQARSAQHHLVIADLEQITPQYISNVAVDYWRKKPSLKEPSYSVDGSVPDRETERIDHHARRTMREKRNCCLATCTRRMPW
ncbi:hypothetical protein OS493_023136 [Desmophyllum pertusum]|uniref:Uncharacterized protein n=1 Tax=Desmophyllum pertusum TaxID=174260 RepID=A0A9W9YYL4_9CNID|nr:hypothetical protein OS493_023136 [Desmophyllum pertusum]